MADLGRIFGNLFISDSTEICHLGQQPKTTMPERCILKLNKRYLNGNTQQSNDNPMHRYVPSPA
jgi:hypothetical protein